MARAKNFYEAVFETEWVKLDNPDAELWGFPMAFGEMGCPGALVKAEGYPSGGDTHRSKFDRPIRFYRVGNRYRREHVRVAFDGLNSEM